MSYYNDPHGLFKDHPNFTFRTATPASYNFYTKRLNEPTNGRSFKNYITEDQVKENTGKVPETVLDKDTRSRLYENTNNFHDLPTAVRNIETIMQNVSRASTIVSDHKSANRNIVEGTIEKYRMSDRKNENIKVLEGYLKKDTAETKPVKHKPVQEKYVYTSIITESDTDEMYMNILRSRAKMVAEHVSNNKFYSKWCENWKLLNYNLKRTKYLFNRLDQSDADIAYVINKGDEVSFRIRDEIRYVPVNIYQYVLYHEMAHMSTTELQHTPKFHELLNILSFAAFELGLIDIRRTTKEYWNTNGQPILCRAALQDEIIVGAEWLMQANPKHIEYFENIIKTVENMGD